MNEVLLYAAIATIVCLMFYSVLGKSVGRGPESGPEPEDFFDSKSDKQKNQKQAAAMDDEHANGLSAIASADPNFSPGHFIDGAKSAYSMILEAFAGGDRDMLSSLLSPDVYKVYLEAIEDRESRGLKQVTDLGRLKRARIVDAQKKGKMAHIQVEYEAELTSALLDEDGQVVEGDADVLATVSEVWTFERNLSSKDPNWRLSDVAPSEGDALEADPTPDTKT